MLERISRGFVAGCVGTAAKTTVNILLQKAHLTNLSSLEMGAEMIPRMSRRTPYGPASHLVGGITSMGIGGGYGSLAAVVTDSRRSRRSWVLRGFQLGTVAYTLNMTLGTRAIPSSVKGHFTVKDALWQYVGHMAYGLVTAGLIEWLDTDREGRAGRAGVRAGRAGRSHRQAKAPAMQWWRRVEPAMNGSRVTAK